MKHLIIYSHPNPKSFNHAIAEAFIEGLEENNHEARMRDLYAFNFDPRLTIPDITACKKGQPPEDIGTEQEHIKWADIITFIGPLWWGGFPAITKGYMDRVLSDGFAYTGDENGPKGLLPDKKVFTIMTGDAPERVYEKSGLFKSMDHIFDDITCQFCALKVIGHKYFMSVNEVDDAQRKKMLQEVKKIASKISK
jgi:NAD(P)H dehydrogenase (quinone)